MTCGKAGHGRFGARVAIVVGVATALTASGCASAGGTEVAGAATAPAASFELITVERSGSGRALVFVPGLASPASVWAETAERYAGTHEVHLVQVAGFAGAPAVQREPFLASVVDELAAYIQSRGLETPVVVGHSLGGFAALDLAIRHPGAASALVVVDGLPFLGGLQMQGMPAEQLAEQAENMRRWMAMQSPEQVRVSQESIMPTMLADRAHALRLAEETGRSDAWAVAQAMYELMVTDLRDGLSSIDVPVVVAGSWVGYGARDLVETNFRRQYENLPGIRIRLSESGRHFLMYDDPELVHHAIAEALDGSRTAGR